MVSVVMVRIKVKPDLSSNSICVYDEEVSDIARELNFNSIVNDFFLSVVEEERIDFMEVVIVNEGVEHPLLDACIEKLTYLLPDVFKRYVLIEETLTDIIKSYFK